MRNVRNFWVETEVDGRKTIDASGPRGKDGGFVTTVYVRKNGESVEALTLVGRTSQDGSRIRLEVHVRDKCMLDLDIIYGPHAVLECER